MFITTGNCTCCKKTNVTGVYDTYIGFVCIKCDPQTFNNCNDSEL